jgi:MOZ/SAS family
VRLTVGYLLSKMEDKLGSPEKPLSDLGLLSYRQFWRTKVVQAILSLDSAITSIQDISEITRMTHDDTIQTLQLMDMLHKTDVNEYMLCLNMPELEKYDARIKAKGYLQVKEENLKWDPILLHRMLIANDTEDMAEDELLVTQSE